MTEADQQRQELSELAETNRVLTQQLRALQQDETPVTSTRSKDSASSTDLGGKRNIPKLELNNLTDEFQDEFMSKVDEFSPSWREGILLHKVPASFN